jgi:hypothetical protein
MSKARDIASAAPAPSTVSATEIGYLDGVTSAIQTQIDAKIGSASAINPTIVDAKGDIIAATAADTVARLAVGANGTVLTAASGQATGLEWATVAAGSNWSLLNSGGTALTGAATITISGISGKDKIMAIVTTASASGGSEIDFRLNADSGSNYSGVGVFVSGSTTYSQNTTRAYSNTSISVANFARQAGENSDTFSGGISFTGCNSSGIKAFQVTGGAGGASGTNPHGYIGHGLWNNSATVTSISILSSVGNFDAGTIYIYTSA